MDKEISFNIYEIEQIPSLYGDCLLIPKACQLVKSPRRAICEWNQTSVAVAVSCVHIFLLVVKQIRQTGEKDTCFYTFSGQWGNGVTNGIQTCISIQVNQHKNIHIIPFLNWGEANPWDPKLFRTPRWINLKLNWKDKTPKLRFALGKWEAQRERNTRPEPR